MIRGRSTTEKASLTWGGAEDLNPDPLRTIANWLDSFVRTRPKPRFRPVDVG